MAGEDDTPLLLKERQAMAQELQSLLEKIQQEGLAKAESQAQVLLQSARKQADQILSEARAAADATRAKAEQDGAVFAERARASLNQAARDVVLSVSNMLTATLRDLVLRDVRTALTPDALQKMLESVVAAYFSNPEEERQIDLLLKPDQADKLRAFLLGRFKDQLRGGLQVKGDSSVLAGFKVNVTDEKVQHDLTDAAIADALSQLLRPQVAAIVKQAMSKR
jgi:V/A-type H+/Na+-transporting ATPase subunit E